MATHYIITNREVSTTPTKGSIKVNAKEYLRTDGAEEAQDNLRYGTVRFSQAVAERVAKDNRKLDLDEVTMNLYPDLHRRDFEKPVEYERRAERFNFGSQRVFEALHDEGLKDHEGDHAGDVLVFIHGYNNDLSEAVETLCHLHYRYIREGSPIKNIVLFTWPARKNLLSYRDDARDAVKSGYALARALLKLRQQFRDLVRNEKPLCDHKLHLMCHSMGNRVAEAMMTELLRENVKPNNMFGEILLMAADVDDDCMEPQKPMHQLMSLGERIHIYYHNNDMALGVSEKTKNAFNRLGRWGARRTIPLPDDVYQADVSYLGDQDERGLKNLFSSEKLVNHWYYIKSPSVVEDVIAVLNGKVTVFNY
ncbi:MAG: alpha/beta hydrolase [Flavobacteriales bacterium]|nr:alpha/beta hydrolase [Flavobacteriales bacterium]MCB9178031.1 alpha/beta hydrolase [Flavobacteriales bacterium]